MSLTVVHVTTKIVNGCLWRST